MVERHADALRGMRAVYIDAGKSDEYFLDLGAEAFRRELERVGVTDVFFELFEGKHGGIVWRYPIALRYLAERAGLGAPQRAEAKAAVELVRRRDHGERLARGAVGQPRRCRVRERCAQQLLDPGAPGRRERERVLAAGRGRPHRRHCGE